MGFRFGVLVCRQDYGFGFFWVFGIFDRVWILLGFGFVVEGGWFVIGGFWFTMEKLSLDIWVWFEFGFGSMFVFGLVFGFELEMFLIFLL